jgi:uncharacterized protein (TIGR02996 family)
VSERAAFIRAICEQPDDDTVRLVFADWLDENGEGERAEFIRVQCELATAVRDREASDRGFTAGHVCNDPACRVCPLRRRERELGTRELLDPADPLRITRRTEIPLSGGAFLENDVFGFGFRRGFVEAVTCFAADFLAHADALVWVPTVKCGDCVGSGFPPKMRYKGGGEDFCSTCDGTGCVPNPAPCPETAQPVTGVTITDAPTLDTVTINDEHVEFNFPGRPMRRIEFGYDERVIDEAAMYEAEWPWIKFTVLRGQIRISTTPRPQVVS